MRTVRPVLLLIAALALQGCATQTPEPANLGLAKQSLRRYVSSGDFDRAMAQAAHRADQWIEQRVTRRTAGERLTVVFDLDDTLFSGWPYISEFDFGWNETTWQAWVDAAHAAPIIPVREVYRHARRLDIGVIFLTARPERQRAATIRNLQAIDCAAYDSLILKPDELKIDSATFKAAERKKLTEGGRVIIAMIGDQDSDLAGGYAERTFKLPNPFYQTP